MDRPLPQSVAEGFVPLARIGSGGQAEILLAVQKAGAGFQKLVVLKRLWPHLAADEDSRRRLTQEARLAARIHHPNVCQVLNLLDDEDGPIMVLEYLHGLTMSIIGRRLPTARTADDVRFVVTAMQQACEGLHYAHELAEPSGRAAGLVHRDVSSNNVLVTREGITKVLDFGVAKASSTENTNVNRIRGTLCFMSPEQLRAEDLTRRSDIFSLGVVAYEGLSGKGLFRGKTVEETMDLIASSAAPTLCRHQPGVTAQLDAAVGKALSKDPRDRFGTAQEFGAALARSVAELGGVMGLAESASYLQAQFGPELAERHDRIAMLSSGSTGTFAVSQTTLTADAFGPGSKLPTLDLTVVMDEADRPGSTPTEATVALRPAHRSIPRGARLDVNPSPRARHRAWAWTVSATIVVALAWVVWARISPQPRAAAPRDAESENIGMGQPHVAIDAGSPRVQTSLDAGGAPRAAEETQLARAKAPRSTSSSRKDRGAASSHSSPPTKKQPAGGFFTLDSRPFCAVTIDGKRVGRVPLYRLPLAPGPHRVVATLDDGRQRSFRITIESGEELRRRLTW